MVLITIIVQTSQTYFSKKFKRRREVNRQYMRNRKQEKQIQEVKNNKRGGLNVRLTEVRTDNPQK